VGHHPDPQAAERRLLPGHPSYFYDTALIEIKGDSEGLYFVAPDVLPLLAGLRVSPRAARLRYCITKQKVPFLWPLKMPREDQRRDNWRARPWRSRSSPRPPGYA